MNTALDADVAIAGGGMAGLACALACAHEGLSAVVIDAQVPAVQLDGGFDGRASAIAYANFRMLDRLGAGEALRRDAQRIETILVTDGRAPDGLRAGGPGAAFLWFGAKELDDRPDGEPLGFMVENRRMRAALLDAVAAQGDRIRHIAPAVVASATADGGGVTVQCADGQTLRARVLAAADGATSKLRAAAGIRAYGWGYDQHGVVATVRAEQDHGGVAHEYFLPAGPFAILPLTDRRASLVWTERSAAAAAVAALPDDAFLGEIRRRFGDFLGTVTLEPGRWTYPLGLNVAARFVGDRLALVGDSARRIHPIAGQGFNLGLKDAAAFAETLGDAARLGLDIGAADALERYQRWRRFDSVMLAAATDVFTRLYSNDFGPVRLLRGAGLRLVNAMPFARRAFTRNAGADMGDLPRLLQA